MTPRIGLILGVFLLLIGIAGMITTFSDYLVYGFSSYTKTFTTSLYGSLSTFFFILASGLYLIYRSFSGNSTIRTAYNLTMGDGDITYPDGQPEQCDVSYNLTTSEFEITINGGKANIPLTKILDWAGIPEDVRRKWI